MTNTPPLEPEETKNRYREDSRIMMQALTEGESIRDFRNPNPVAGGVKPFTQQQIEGCLADGILKRIAWSLPAAATQKMWLLSLGDDYSSSQSSKIVKDYYNYHTKLRSRERCRRAMQFARSHGGAVIVINVDDGRHYSEPVDEKNIKSITGLIVRHRWQVSPFLRTARSIFDLDDVEHYEILTVDEEIKNKLLFKSNSMKWDDRLIHTSRILRFEGSLMPDDWMIQYNSGWGLSIFDEIWKYYKYYTNGLNAVGELIKTHSVLQHSFEGLRELMASSPDESILAIKQTMKSIRLMYDLYGMVLHDSREQFNWNARPVTGMDALVNVHRDAFIGASNMPHTKLFGESPGGLGRDGKETQINWANTTSEYQGENLEPRIEQLDRYLFLAKDSPTKGNVLEDYQRQYPSVLRLSIEDVRAGRTADMQNLAAGIQAGILTEEEARTVPANSDWWPELNLDQDAWAKQKQKSEETEEDSFIFPESQINQDSSTLPIKRVINWQGLNIGVTHDAGDLRYSKTMRSGYGHIRGSYGKAEDSKSIDAYIGDLNNPNLWKVRQLNPYSGELDETKYFIGFNNAKEVKDCYEYHAGSDRFGGVEKCAPTELSQYRQDADLDEEDWISQELQQQLGSEVLIWVDEIKEIMEDVGKNYDDEQARKDALETRINELELPSESLTEKLYQHRVLADLVGRLNTGNSDRNPMK